MKKVTVNYNQLRDIYDAFGSVFFGFIRAMNIAHQGWMYAEAIELCKKQEIDDQNGIVYPEKIEIKNNFIDFEYFSRSGNKYRFTHTGRNNGNLYYEIDIEFSANSSLAGTIETIANQVYQ